MNKIKVLLVDDHQIIIDGLKLVLQKTDDIEVSGEANNGKEAIHLAGLLHFDVILMDIDMPVMNGIDTLKNLRKSGFNTKVIILSMHHEAGMVKNLIALGADGYLLKNAGADEVTLAIRKVMTGKQHFSSDVTISMLNTHSQQPIINPIPEILLTSRETEILQLIAKGFSNKEIGKSLFISHRTVDTHRTNLMSKLGVNNVAGLVTYAIKNGIV
jgi:DNA-binding NarL/FixJ family response regulator